MIRSYIFGIAWHFYHLHFSVYTFEKYFCISLKFDRNCILCESVKKERWVWKTPVQNLTNLKRQIAAKLSQLKSWYMFLPNHANCKNIGPVWKVGLCNSGQLGRIYALSLYPLYFSNMQIRWFAYSWIFIKHFGRIHKKIETNGCILGRHSSHTPCKFSDFNPTTKG